VEEWVASKRTLPLQIRLWLGQTQEINISPGNYAFVGNSINVVKEKRGY
jgi:hypothetical protein